MKTKINNLEVPISYLEYCCENFKSKLNRYMTLESRGEIKDSIRQFRKAIKILKRSKWKTKDRN